MALPHTSFARSLLAVWLVALALASWPRLPSAEETRAVPQSKTQVTLSFAPVVKKAAPAVVNVYAQRVEKLPPRNPLFDDPVFRRFFGEGKPPRRREGAIARLRRDRRSVRPRRDQQSRHREHDRREGGAARPPRIPGGNPAARSAQRSRHPAHQGRRPRLFRCWNWAIPTPSRSATSRWPSATPSASARP